MERGPGTVGLEPQAEHATGRRGIVSELLRRPICEEEQARCGFAPTGAGNEVRSAGIRARGGHLRTPHGQGGLRVV